MLVCRFPVRIMARSGGAGSKVSVIARLYDADAADPLAYRCLTCKLEWDCCPLDDFTQVVCSNCYSERVVLVLLRLGFENWGKQNGGAKQQRSRFRAAKIAAAGALLARSIPRKKPSRDGLAVGAV